MKIILGEVLGPLGPLGPGPRFDPPFVPIKMVFLLMSLVLGPFFEGFWRV